MASKLLNIATGLTVDDFVLQSVRYLAVLDSIYVPGKLIRLQHFEQGQVIKGTIMVYSLSGLSR